jgi:hypothetical protein
MAEDARLAPQAYGGGMTKPGDVDDPARVEIQPDVHRPSIACRGWRRPLIGLLVVLASLTLVVPAGVAIASRVRFGTFAFWSVPNRVDYCGRRYYEAGTQPGSPALFRSTNSNKEAKWEQVASTFTGRPIYGVVSPITSGPREQVCTVVLFMPAGNGQWTAYPLSGGP